MDVFVEKLTPREMLSNLRVSWERKEVFDLANEIPVVFSTDNAYVPYTGVALQTMINCVNKELQYSVYILHTGLSDNSKRRLVALSTENVKLHFIDVTAEMQYITIKSVHHLTPESTYRLLIPDLLPQYDKVLYLDSDIVIMGDVAELYNTNIGNHVVGAAPDGAELNQTLIEYFERVGLDVSPNEYFNAGILLINTALFKKMRIRDKCFEMLQGETKFIYLDQDALNKFCNGNVHYFDVRWNYSWFFFLYLSSPYNLMHPDELRIVHFVGEEKPWYNPELMNAEYFWEHAKKSPFYEEILYKSIDMQTLSTLNQRIRNIHPIFSDISTKFV